MYISTDAVILHVTPYSDKTLITSLYTEHGGRIDCITPRGSGKKSPLNMALLSPLNLVKAQIYSKPTSQIARLTAVESNYIVRRDDMVRQCIRMYMAEVLYRTIKQPLPDSELFRFINNSVMAIDSELAPANLHIHFLLQLTRYLGIEPNTEQGGGYFDLESGLTTAQKPLHPDYLEPRQTELMSYMLSGDYSKTSTIALSRGERQQLIYSIELYYKLHIPDFKGTKSLETLSQLFD